MALVTIGTQTWDDQNLDVDAFGDGASIVEVSASDQWQRCADAGTPAWCYYDFDTANSNLYGRLYNWYVVSASITAHPIVENPQWKIPSRGDYNTLATYLGGRNLAGFPLKNSENWLTNLRRPGNGSNASGWKGNPGGFTKTDGSFFDLGWSGNWWTQTTASTVNSYVNKLYYADTSIRELTPPNGMGFSIRLILSGSWTGSNGFRPSENWYG